MGVVLTYTTIPWGWNKRPTCQLSLVHTMNGNTPWFEWLLPFALSLPWLPASLIRFRPSMLSLSLPTHESQIHTNQLSENVKRRLFSFWPQGGRQLIALTKSFAVNCQSLICSFIETGNLAAWFVSYPVTIFTSDNLTVSVFYVFYSHSKYYNQNKIMSSRKRTAQIRH